MNPSNTIDFLMALSKNIPGRQLHVGSFKSFSDNYKIENCYYKEHPLNVGYQSIEKTSDLISNEVTGYSSSFFSYWKKVKSICSN